MRSAERHGKGSFQLINRLSVHIIGQQMIYLRSMFSYSNNVRMMIRFLGQLLKSIHYGFELSSVWVPNLLSRWIKTEFLPHFLNSGQNF